MVLLYTVTILFSFYAISFGLYASQLAFITASRITKHKHKHIVNNKIVKCKFINDLFRETCPNLNQNKYIREFSEFAEFQKKECFDDSVNAFLMFMVLTFICSVSMSVIIPSRKYNDVLPKFA
jgi:hypothetical protein